MKNGRRYLFLDCDFFEHPKVLRVGMIAAILYLRCLTHAAKFETDGFVARDIVDRYRAPRDRRSVEALLKEKLWHKVRGGFVIHDYLRYQKSHAQLERAREKGAERFKKWASKNEEGRSKSDEAREDPPKKPGVSSRANGVANAPRDEERRGETRQDHSGGEPRPIDDEALPAEWLPDYVTLSRIRHDFDVDPTPAIEAFRRHFLGLPRDDRHARNRDWNARFEQWCREDVKRGRLPATKAHTMSERREPHDDEAPLPIADATAAGKALLETLNGTKGKGAPS